MAEYQQPELDISEPALVEIVHGVIYPLLENLEPGAVESLLETILEFVESSSEWLNLIASWKENEIKINFEKGVQLLQFLLGCISFDGLQQLFPEIEFVQDNAFRGAAGYRPLSIRNSRSHIVVGRALATRGRDFPSRYYHIVSHEIDHLMVKGTSSKKDSLFYRIRFWFDIGSISPERILYKCGMYILIDEILADLAASEKGSSLYKTSFEAADRVIKDAISYPMVASTIKHLDKTRLERILLQIQNLHDRGFSATRLSKGIREVIIRLIRAHDMQLPDEDSVITAVERFFVSYDTEQADNIQRVSNTDIAKLVLPVMLDQIIHRQIGYQTKNGYQVRISRDGEKITVTYTHQEFDSYTEEYYYDGRVLKTG